ncbi:MAG: 4Fe-4S cluster-binding domain-containing protein [Bacteroidetes bacterium]|nr:4Fe-4S cluster-binding domain-containing protein [Bacteroidota bacterium]
MNFDNPLTQLDVLKDCTICPRNCHADRFSCKPGYCKSDASFNISSICIHSGEEPPVSGKEGICNVFFTNCNLQCIYCQNWQISDTRVKRQDTQMTFEQVVERIIHILDKGINRVGFVSPSHFVPQVKAIIHAVQLLGYRPVWVYNSNGFDKVETLRSLENLINVYLPDFKYSDPEIASEYSDAADYPGIAASALKEMYRQKGAALHLSDVGTVESGIIIRHLVLPGHVTNSLGVLRYIAEEVSQRLHISLMSQYYPTPGVSCHPELKRTVTSEEYKMVTSEMEKLGLYNGWIQEPESTRNYRPDFNQDHPFE